MRYGRLVVNLVITAACVSLVALEIAGPSNATPTRRPVDTFTHVDVTVDDHGVHVPVHQAPAGEVEMTLTDARAHKNGVLTVTSDPHALTLHAGTQLITMRDLVTYQLHANAGSKGLAGVDSLTIVMPRLDPAREAASRVTVNVDTTGINTPHRDARFEPPIAAENANPPNASIPWTTVDAGSATVVIQNHRPTALHCSVAGGTPRAISNGATQTFRVSFVRGDNLVDCGATKLDLVV